MTARAWSISSVSRGTPGKTSESTFSCGQSPWQSGLLRSHLTGWVNSPSLLVCSAVWVGIKEISEEGPLAQAASAAHTQSIAATRKGKKAGRWVIILWSGHPGQIIYGATLRRIPMGGY